MLFCWIQNILSETPCKLPTHRSGSMGMDSKRATSWESCSLQALLAQLGCQALRWEAERLGKQAVPVPQRHAGAQGSSEEGSWAVGWASPLPLLLEISPARSSALGLFVLGFFFLNPKISGFEAFVSFCLQFCDKISFHKKGGNHQQKHFREFDIFHDLQGLPWTLEWVLVLGFSKETEFCTSVSPSQRTWPQETS